MVQLPSRDRRSWSSSRSWLALAAALVAAAGCVALPRASRAAPPAVRAKNAPGTRNAVLFIGDGMGPAYVTLTRVAHAGSAGRLRIDTLPYTALSRTHSSDSPVTDSAAAASAMACGKKTANGVLCEDDTAVYAKKDGVRLESIAVWAKKRGLRVGLVTTTTVTHATPAAFYAQQRDREDEAEIAGQAIASGFDLILGGGRRYFPAELRARGEKQGWIFVETAAALGERTTLAPRVMGLFAEGHLPYQPQIEADAKRTAPTLPEMTRFAVDALRKGGRPFFLMVEGGRIDHAGHANWARTLVDETVAFDESIGYAIDTLDPKTTLVLVTADHETGGLALNGYPTEKDGVWSTYTDPQAEEGDEPCPVVTFSSGPGVKRQTATPPHGGDDARPSGVSLGSAAHTGVDVALYAWGAGAERVHGTVENTEIYAILRAHLEGTGYGR